MLLKDPPALAEQNTRQRVLDAVLTLFTERGYFNTSVQDIARLSQVSVGSIYHHFKDKEGIACALYQALLDRMTVEIMAICAKYKTTHDQCRAIVTMLFDLTEREPRAMEFMLYAKHREFMPDEKPVCSSRPFELMRTILEEGMRRGEVRKMETVVASTGVFGGPLRMITARLDGLVEKPLPEYLNAVWRCSWRTVAK